MQRSANISTVLNRAVKNSNFNQKGLAQISQTPTATVSDHIGGREVKFDKAMDYLEAFEKEGDVEATNNLTSDYSYSYLGFIKSMDGKLVEVCSTAELEIFQQLESNERKERKSRAEILLVQSKIRQLDQYERGELKSYVLEFLDEIIVELAIVFSILKILGMTIQEAIRLKMPEWIAKKYMRK